MGLDEHHSIRVVLIDYAKAFDHVDHITVIKKLADLGIPLILLRWIHSFLMDCEQRVKISKTVSDWISPDSEWRNAPENCPWPVRIPIADQRPEISSLSTQVCR
jgi:Reverse transcriptase (RNA-dependent DNA polymerase)